MLNREPFKAGSFQGLLAPFKSVVYLFIINTKVNT
jgi:hypothetical protein